MQKTIINTFVVWLLYFIFSIVANNFYSFSFWKLYVGGLFGLVLSNVDHLLHVLVIYPQELTSLRVLELLKTKRYKELLALLYDTREERKGLIFHTLQFQMIYRILTFWVITSSGSLFVKGLVLSYFMNLVLYNFRKFILNEPILNNGTNSRVYIVVLVLALFIFGILI